MLREKQTHKIEVHVSAICIAQVDGRTRVLIGKRADNREIMPGYWECGGGQVHTGETFEKAIRNQLAEEFGIDAEVLMPVTTYSIALKDTIIPGVRLLCRVTRYEPVRIDMMEIVDFAWVDPIELSNYRTIPGLANDIQKAVKVFEWLFTNTAK